MGARFPVKGREINASVLFCDISRFSQRTLELNPTEIFVNNFFTWITAEALRERPARELWLMNVRVLFARGNLNVFGYR